MLSHTLYKTIRAIAADGRTRSAAIARTPDYNTRMRCYLIPNKTVRPFDECCCTRECSRSAIGASLCLQSYECKRRLLGPLSREIQYCSGQMLRGERVYLVPSFWRSVSEETYLQSHDIFGYKVGHHHPHHLDDKTSSLF